MFGIQKGNIYFHLNNFRKKYGKFQSLQACPSYGFALGWISENSKCRCW